MASLTLQSSPHGLLARLAELSDAGGQRIALHLRRAGLGMGDGQPVVIGIEIDIQYAILIAVLPDLRRVILAHQSGRAEEMLQHLFGTPGLVRKDDPAQVWQYRNQDCVLDIYLYPDHDRLTVAHAEARAPKVKGDPLPACIAEFSQSRQKTVG